MSKLLLHLIQLNIHTKLFHWQHKLDCHILKQFECNIVNLSDEFISLYIQAIGRPKLGDAQPLKMTMFNTLQMQHFLHKTSAFLTTDINKYVDLQKHCAMESCRLKLLENVNNMIVYLSSRQASNE